MLECRLALCFDDFRGSDLTQERICLLSESIPSRTHHISTNNRQSWRRKTRLFPSLFESVKIKISPFVGVGVLAVGISFSKPVVNDLAQIYWKITRKKDIKTCSTPDVSMKRCGVTEYTWIKCVALIVIRGEDDAAAEMCRIKAKCIHLGWNVVWSYLVWRREKTSISTPPPSLRIHRANTRLIDRTFVGPSPTSKSTISEPENRHLIDRTDVINETNDK